MDLIYDQWLDPSATVDVAKALRGQNKGGEFEFYRVEQAVNSSKTENDPSLIESLTD